MYQSVKKDVEEWKQFNDVDSNTSGFESVDGDEECESYNGSEVGGSGSDSNSDDEKNPKQNVPITDDDGFETVSAKGRRKR